LAKLAELLLGTENYKPFTFKHTKRDGTLVDVEVAIRPLTKVEIDRARANAHKTVQDLLKNAQAADLREGRTYEELLDEARAVELLAIALRDPQKPGEPWSTPMEMAMTLHPDAIGLLSEQWEAHQHLSGPKLQDLTDDEFNAIVAAIALEGRADPFFLFASPLRNLFITRLAKEAFTSRMASSSASSDSNESSTASANEKTGEAEVADHRLLLDRVEDLTIDVDQLRELLTATQLRVASLEGEKLGNDLLSGD